MVVVAAVDASDSAPAVVREANELATQFGDELHVLHVMSQSEFVELETTSVDETGQPIEMDRVREVAADTASSAADSAGVEADRVVGRVGDASGEILDYADDTDARYIVVGGRKRSPAGKAIFGSVSQSTLLNADRPVVVIMASE